MKRTKMMKCAVAAILSGMMLLPGVIVHAEDAQQIPTEVEIAETQDEEALAADVKPEDAVKVEVILDSGDGIVREGKNNITLKVENISDWTIHLSSIQVSLIARAKNWSDTGSTAYYGDISGLAPTGPAIFGGSIELNADTIKKWTETEAGKTDPAEYFLQASMEVKDHNGQTATVKYELPVEIAVAEKPLFDDVTKDAWFYEQVKFVKENGLMTGLNDKTFGPSESLARAQFAVILYRIEESPAVDFTDKFGDIGEGVWFTDAIMWASEANIVTGYSNGNFGPSDNINREQMALMMYRYANHKGYDTSEKADFSNFSDAANVSDFAEEAMQWAVGTGIISGKSNGTIDPQGEAVRAECATIIQRFVNTYGM